MARVLVLGGGAAGLVAAWRAASLGHRVVLVEGNTRLGLKLRISGGGKCNLTHEGSPVELLSAFAKVQARFLRPAVHAFPPEAVRAFFRDRGVETYVRENGRVFPLDRPESAAEVLRALERAVREVGVEIRVGVRAEGLVSEGQGLSALRMEDGRRLEAEAFILATGGASYPQTGTRGEVLDWLKGLGLPVHPWVPALAPIPLVRPRPAWEGVALRGGTLVLRAGAGGRHLDARPGDLLFTRTGLSGPAALALSQLVERSRREGPAWLAYQPAGTDSETLDAALVELAHREPRLGVRTWLHRFLPERLCEALIREQGLASDQRVQGLERAQRRALAALAAALPLGEPGPVDLAKGEVAAGGLALGAVDPRTLQVRGWTNLRVCGELLDVDGPVGGYNLQAAFSTGFLAGSISPGSS